MDRVALKTLFAEAATSGWSLQSDIKLQEWLEGYAERLKGRTNAVADEVQQLVEQMGSVELNLQNTFNSFRCLSSSQFVENRVYEEDETEVVSAGVPKKPVKAAKEPAMPTESYEEEILPRYKDAVASAWAALQEGSRQRDQTGRSQSKLRDSHLHDWAHVTPHIIGTEAFARDQQCGLAEISRGRQVADDLEFSPGLERNGVNLAAELVSSGIVSEGEWSENSSDSPPGYQEGGLEPAVSAALDFKAMLEAALRNPSLPYDGGTWESADSSIGQSNDNKLSLQNLTSDSLSNSSRARSRKSESKDDEVGESTSEGSDFNVNNNEEAPTSHHPADIPVPSMPAKSAELSKPLQPDQDEPIHAIKIEEILKKPSNPQAQAMLNEEYKQLLESMGGQRQVGSSGFNRSTSLKGRFFATEEADVAKRVHPVLSNSSTGPTIPEALFQNQPPLDASRHARSYSGSSNSVNSSQVQQSFQAALTNTLRAPPDEDLDLFPTELKRKEVDKAPLAPFQSPSQAANVFSPKFRVATSSNVNAAQQKPVATSSNVSVAPQQPVATSSNVNVALQEPVATSSDVNWAPQQPVATSSNVNVSLQQPVATSSNVEVAPQQAVPLYMRGGLFDDDEDDEDEDEDALNLFGPSAVRAESQPVVDRFGPAAMRGESQLGAPLWESPSSKGLFDDIQVSDPSVHDETTWSSDNSESSHPVQVTSVYSSVVAPKFEILSSHEDEELQKQSPDSIPLTSSWGDTSFGGRASLHKGGVRLENQTNEGREYEHPTQSVLAAPPRLTVVDDDDFWSSSEGEDDSTIAKQADMAQEIAQGSTLILLETNDNSPSESSVGPVLNVKPSGSIDGGHLPQSTSSAQNSAPLIIHAEGPITSLSPLGVHEIPAVLFPEATSRSLSDSKEVLEKAARALHESLPLQSDKLQLSESDESDFEEDSVACGIHDGQFQAVQDRSPPTEHPPQQKSPVSSQSTGFVRTLLPSSAQSPVKAEDPTSPLLSQADGFVSNPLALSSQSRGESKDPISPLSSNATGFVSNPLMSTPQNPVKPKDSSPPSKKATSFASNPLTLPPQSPVKSKGPSPRSSPATGFVSNPLTLPTQSPLKVSLRSSPAAIFTSNPLTLPTQNPVKPKDSSAGQSVVSGFVNNPLTLSEHPSPPSRQATGLVSNPLTSSLQHLVRGEDPSSPLASQAVGFASSPLTLSAQNSVTAKDLSTPISSQATGFVSNPLTSPVQDSAIAKNPMSEDVKTPQSVVVRPAKTSGRVTSNRAFTSLFEDDDAEDDLFGKPPPKQQGGLFQGTGRHDSGFTSQSSFNPNSGGRPRAVDKLSNVRTPDVTPKVSQASSDQSTGTSRSKLMDVDKKEPDLPSKKSNLSSLLFGDDDEDDENSLFGPLGGRSSRGKTAPKSGKAKALFGDDDDDDESPITSSRRAKLSSSLFGD